MEKEQSLKTKIALDILVTPWTIIPGGVGLSLMMLSLILGSHIGFLGFCSCLVSLGSLICNFVFNFDSISKRAKRDWMDAIKKRKNEKLDSLDRKLVKNRDPRDQTALRDLRIMYNEFQRDVVGGKISQNVTGSMLSQVDQIFDACIHELEQADNICVTMNKKISSTLKSQLSKQREEMIVAVQESVGNMALVINEIRSIRQQSNVDELKTLGLKLSQHLETAKRVEERVSKFGLEDNLERFDKYVSSE